MKTSMGVVWLATQMPSDFGRSSRLWNVTTAEMDRLKIRKHVRADLLSIQ
jgi:hypothetical protein